MSTSVIPPSSTSSVYNNIAKEFKRTRHYKWSWITEFFNNISCNSNLKQKVLDIGCGSGRNISAYQSNNIEIKGIDNSNEFIKLCKSDGLDAVLSDMTNLPFSDSEFDHIISIASFHHLTNISDRIKCLKEMRRVLKPNGLILLSVWSKNQPAKTKRVFNHWGDTNVPWKSISGEIYQRYYYIFKIPELETLFNQFFDIVDYKWDCGNEIFILKGKN